MIQIRNQVKKISYKNPFLIPQIKVLVVDDDVTNIQIIKFFLSKIKKFQFEIIEAVEGKLALDQYLIMNEPLSIESIDIVITDINMPIMNGLEFCNQINEYISKYNYQRPIILVVSSEEDGLHSECQQLMIDQILKKPVKYKTFSETLI